MAHEINPIQPSAAELLANVIPGQSVVPNTAVQFLPPVYTTGLITFIGTNQFSIPAGTYTFELSGISTSGGGTQRGIFLADSLGVALPGNIDQPVFSDSFHTLFFEQVITFAIPTIVQIQYTSISNWLPIAHTWLRIRKL